MSAAVAFSPIGEKGNEAAFSPIGENGELPPVVAVPPPQPLPQPVSVPFAEAVRIAKRILDALSEYCEEISTAGALRRGCASVDKIDIVCLPKSSRDGDKLCDRLGRNTRVVSATGREGRDLMRLLTVPHLGDVQINLVKARAASPDLFAGDPSNWGIRLLMVTGHARHTVRLAAAAEDRGFRFDTLRGVLRPDGRVIASATEADIYGALGLRYYEPHERETADF